MFRNADDVTLAMTSHFSPRNDGPSTDPTQLAQYQGPFPTSARRLPSHSSCFRVLLVCLGIHGCAVVHRVALWLTCVSQSWALFPQLRHEEVLPKHRPDLLSHCSLTGTLCCIRFCLTRICRLGQGGSVGQPGGRAGPWRRRLSGGENIAGRWGVHTRDLINYESSRCLALPCVPQRIGSWKEYVRSAQKRRLTLPAESSLW